MKSKRGLHLFDSKAGAAIVGILIAASTFILCALFSALLLTFTNMPTRGVELSGLVALTVSGGISGLLLSKTQKDGMRLRGLLSISLFCAVILIISLILSGGKIGGRIFMNCGCYILISSLCLFLGGRKTKRRRRRA